MAALLGFNVKAKIALMAATALEFSIVKCIQASMAQMALMTLLAKVTLTDIKALMAEIISNPC